jgi:mRNA interferase RelE/StbE
MNKLCAQPFPSGVKKLYGLQDHFRIRVGDYRVIYRVDGRRVVVVIVRIGHRRDVYR